MAEAFLETAQAAELLSKFFEEDLFLLNAADERLAITVAKRFILPRGGRLVDVANGWEGELPTQWGVVHARVRKENGGFTIHVWAVQPHLNHALGDAVRRWLASI